MKDLRTWLFCCVLVVLGALHMGCQTTKPPVEPRESEKQDDFWKGYSFVGPYHDGIWTESKTGYYIGNSGQPTTNRQKALYDALVDSYDNMASHTDLKGYVTLFDSLRGNSLEDKRLFNSLSELETNGYIAYAYPVAYRAHIDPNGNEYWECLVRFDKKDFLNILRDQLAILQQIRHNNTALSERDKAFFDRQIVLFKDKIGKERIPSAKKKTIESHFFKDFGNVSSPPTWKLVEHPADTTHMYVNPMGDLSQTRYFLGVSDGRGYTMGGSLGLSKRAARRDAARKVILFLKTSIKMKSTSAFFSETSLNETTPGAVASGESILLKAVASKIENTEPFRRWYEANGKGSSANVRAYALIKFDYDEWIRGDLNEAYRAMVLEAEELEQTAKEARTEEEEKKLKQLRREIKGAEAILKSKDVKAGLE